MSTILVFSSLTVFSFTNVRCGFADQTNENQLRRKDTIYLSVFLSDTGTLDWNENLWFDFNNTGNIPLNTSLVFDQHFQNADYSIYQWQSWDQFVMLLTVSYDAINIDLAENKTDVLCNAFQRAFDLQLNVIDGSHRIDNNTGYVTVSRRLGYIRLINTVSDISTIEELAKYKPDDGFGSLINSGFLSHWLSDPSRGGLFHLQYTAKRVDSGNLSWRFVIGLEPSYGRINGNEEYVDINLNNILNHSGSIVPLPISSQILLSIIKKSITNSGTYSMTFSSLSPNYTSFDESGDPLVTYALAGPIDNVFATVRINKENETANWADILKFAGIATIILASIAIAIVIFIKKCRKKETNTSVSSLQVLKTVVRSEGGECYAN